MDTDYHKIDIAHDNDIVDNDKGNNNTNIKLKLVFGHVFVSAVIMSLLFFHCRNNNIGEQKQLYHVSIIFNWAIIYISCHILYDFCVAIFIRVIFGKVLSHIKDKQEMKKITKFYNITLIICYTTIYTFLILIIYVF